jgi:hypothetical protein
LGFAARGASTALRWSVAACAAIALLGAPSRGAAVILSGGPTYNLPGGGSCSVSGIPSVGGGATLTCTGINLAAHTKVYLGIRNDTNVNGNTMTGVNPVAGGPEVFRFLTSNANSITYESDTSINSAVPAFGSDPVENRLVLTRTGGTGTVVAAAGNPANNSRGDVGALFQITSGSSFTLDVDVQASSPHFALGNACTAVYDPSHSTVGNGGDRSKVDIAFYFSDCGDSVVDSPEQCDQGAANGTPGSCCTASCQFRDSSQICRPGAGAPCDLSESCTGISATCPPDDAPINMGNVCRTGSGDVCDQNELCTGVPGQGCPADDAPANTSIICRAGSAGDICDDHEFCTGVAGATCPPDDAPSNINVVCRPGSGDVCDPAEQCTGVPGQFCPPDIVANPTTVCRVGSGDSCDPNETCTAIPGQPCPADVVAPSSTTCRAAADACDLAEQCTGAAGQTCPSNAPAPAGTACDADSNQCTVDECDGSFNCLFDAPLDCEDGNICTQDSCDPQDGCVSVGAPAVTCVSGVKSLLKYKNNADPSKDNIKFKWKGGPSLILDQGDPTDSTRYELCIYDGTGVRMAMGVPPGAGWATVGPVSSPKGYKYKDPSAQHDGIKTIKTKANNLDKAQVKVGGKGGNLPDPTGAFVFPVTAQLYASDGMCWESTFQSGDALRNDSSGFIGKLP